LTDGTRNWIVIPSRMGSSRFPGKPLAMINGKTMLEWVVCNAVEAVGSRGTIVATCDDDIAREAERLGVRAVITSDLHERATDRTAEAVAILESEGLTFDSILMLQGDEPTIPPKDLVTVLKRLSDDPAAEIVNLFSVIGSQEEWEDPNCVKVVANSDGSAAYFSRLPIPHGGNVNSGGAAKQVCAIGFRRGALKKFAAQAPGDLEKAESIDMLRWIEHGGEVHLEQSLTPTHPVDVPEDIALVEGLLKAANYSPKV